MEFSLSAEQEEIRAHILALCRRFDDAYWLEHDREGTFPHEFHAAIAKGKWLGIAMPEAFGGAGLGITEAAIMMQAVAESGAAMSGASAIHMNIFGLNPVVVLGSEEQKRRMLLPLIAGADKACFAVTEPDAGLNTTEIKTRARRNGDHYIVKGTKIWISTAQVANKMLLLARTTPLGEARRRTDGLTLFYTDIDRDRMEIREIPKMGRSAVDSNTVFIDGLRVPESDRIGAEGEGFRAILHGMNPERILIAAEAVGIGRVAIARAARYARERIVFGRPIGQNQAIQHPLAQRFVELEAANLMMLKAASLYDRAHDAWRHGICEGIPCRALLARSADRAHRAGDPADDLELHRRARPRPAEVLLRSTVTPPSLGSFQSLRSSPRMRDPDVAKKVWIPHSRE
jgi:acyl-CoA dehydrogenase